MTAEPSRPERRSPFVRRWRGRGRVAQAVSLLIVAGAAQRFVAMPRWTRVIGDPGEVPEEWTPGHEAVLPVRSGDIVEERVRRAIRRAGARLPWTPSCLAEATAGPIMLRRRGTAGVIVVGLRRAHGGAPWESHAWLLGSCGALTGGPAAQGFTAVTVFEVPGGLRAGEVDLSGPATPQADDW